MTRCLRYHKESRCIPDSLSGHILLYRDANGEECPVESIDFMCGNDNEKRMPFDLVFKTKGMLFPLSRSDLRSVEFQKCILGSVLYWVLE